jgi:hypothetical protein
MSDRQGLAAIVARATRNEPFRQPELALRAVGIAP